MDAATLGRLISDHAALRRRQSLQPVGGRGDKIFPPTYPGEGRNAPPRHVFERRRIDGAEVWCVLVDSVQSQANRLEESLLAAAREGVVKLPYVVVDFRGTGIEGLEEITSLDAPHRVYDAILRDSLLDELPFMKSPLGERLAKAKPENATALLEASPNALLFGAWHSTGEGGGLGAKFARCLTSELVAVNAPADEIADRRSGEFEARTAGRRTGSRIDPLGILRKVEVFKGESGWDVTEAGAGKKAKKVRPSEINHGNIAPSVQPLGVTCDRVEHTMVLGFAALRRLRFGTPERDVAGRTLLAALGILAVLEQDRRGYALRSRCELAPEGAAGLELVRSDGTAEPFGIDQAGARALYAEAFAAAERAGFTFPPAPIRLVPQPKLVAVVRESQRLALVGEGGEAEDEGK
ncbi:type I-G CRISPR-associated RAMP protein Csb1/Cas7g [Blastochloris tepida]|uniref:Type I-U CRISPR-associated protein Cas7 n=1 Tax=Blastochloris tepida TaxID=2233851 RepID=A0A348G312_9HYPH|nr:type I-U CRISPR-associated RAMP protein Csb1/Cas7u [Blastochloris tepida]BBF93945.1 type I-U CRISPR-associated protein Cas7 [Blastochloris tepida]